MVEFKRVRLREVRPDDHPLILEWQNDPDVFRRMDYVSPFTLDDIHQSEALAKIEGHPFVIEADGRPIGRTGLNQFRPRDRTAALYLFIGERDAWGKGYGAEALHALLSYGFEELGLNLVWLYTLADNEPAIKLYKRVGFLEEASLRDRSFIEGRTIDHVIMSITRDEFSRMHR